MHEGVREDEYAKWTVGERLDRCKSYATILLAVYDVDPAERDKEERAVRDDEGNVRVIEALAPRSSDSGRDDGIELQSTCQ